MKKILTVLLLAMLIVGCGTPKVQKDFETMLKALQGGNVEEIKKLNPNSEFSVDDEGTKLFLEGYKKMTYKIKNTKVDGDVAIINLDIKAPDLTYYFPEFMQKGMALAFASIGTNSEEMEKIGENFATDFFTEKLNSKDLKYLEKNIDVQFKKNGNDWKIDVENSKNKDFNDVITFGLSKLGEAFGETENKTQELTKIGIAELLKTEKV